MSRKIKESKDVELATRRSSRGVKLTEKGKSYHATISKRRTVKAPKVKAHKPRVSRAVLQRIPSPPPRSRSSSASSKHSNKSDSVRSLTNMMGKLSISSSAQTGQSSMSSLGHHFKRMHVTRRGKPVVSRRGEPVVSRRRHPKSN